MLNHLKYWFGFPAIIYQHGGYYVTKRNFGMRSYLSSSPCDFFWWCRDDYRVKYCKFPSYSEAEEKLKETYAKVC